MKTIARILLALSLCLSVALSSCATLGGVGVSFDPINGVCAISAGGNYAVCYNPLNKAYVVKSRVPGAPGYTLRYDSASKSYRAGLPDGSVAVYTNGVFTIEPALPSGKESPTLL